MSGFIAAGLLGGAIVLGLIGALTVYCSSSSENDKQGIKPPAQSSQRTPADVTTHAGTGLGVEPRSGSSDQNDGIVHKSESPKHS